MQAQRNDAVTHGPYSLFVSFADDGGKMVIQRQDPGRKRTVALIDSLAEWDAFVAALKDGIDEAAAVCAIDRYLDVRETR